MENLTGIKCQTTSFFKENKNTKKIITLLVGVSILWDFIIRFLNLS